MGPEPTFWSGSDFLKRHASAEVSNLKNAESDSTLVIDVDPDPGDLSN